MVTSSSADAQPVDVLVVGMGPVGKMVALLLARAGHSVLVTDRKDAPYSLPRAVAHDAEVARILQNAGTPPDSMPDVVEPYDDMYVWVNGDDEVLHLVDWTGIDPSGWNNTYFYNQPGLEAHLDAAVRKQPRVNVLRGTKAEVLSQDDQGANVQLTTMSTSATSTVRATFVLGADGANSDTRRGAGIEWKDLGYFFDWLVVDIVPEAGVKITHLAKQVADPSRPTTVVPAGPGRRRWEFMLLEGETWEEMARPERIWELLEPFGVRADNARMERGVVYRFDSGWAAEWRKGRVILLGDAAHKMPPFAGQGLAAGFRDCINLAWKLDLVLRGIAEPSLLDSYGAERSDHVSDFIDFSMELGKIICITDPVAAATRDAHMIAERESGRLPEPPPTPRIGTGLHIGEQGGYLSWQGQVSTADQSGSRRYDDVFGPGALILDHLNLAAGLSMADFEALATIGITVTTFAGGEVPSAAMVLPFIDAQGTYAAWFASIGARAVLVRPDFYVFGSATDTAGVENLVAGFLDRIAGGARSLSSLDCAPDSRGR